jgi:D-serine deaminase-like pyridoxal phosphate-dependent protein
MFDRIETPSVIISLEKVRKNLEGMAEIKKYGCALRPHIKTHKIPELAKMQMEYGSCGITCAKMSEAEVMADAGIDDIFVAYPVIGGDKAAKALALNRKVRLILGADSLRGAEGLSDAATGSGIVFEVRMEIDTGMKRTGVPYDKALDLAEAIVKLPGLKLTGIYTFRSCLLDGKPTDKREQAGEQEGMLLAGLADKLRSRSIDIRDVSGGSSPTGNYTARVSGVTEIRPGTYIFNDMMQVNIGAASLDECAAFVLATVISTPADDYAVIDGGSKTFSTDVIPGTAPFFLEGYGKIAGHPDLVLDRLSEEHGVIRSKTGRTGLETGQRLMIIPNHICTTVNLHNHVFFEEDDGTTRCVPVAARGKVY